MSRRLFVTTALPYANGPFHIGHIMEYIQADIWVRFQRMQGHDVTFIGADDAHGAPIMLAAEKAESRPSNSSPKSPRGASNTSTGFTSSSTTGIRLIRRKIPSFAGIYRKLKAAKLIYSKKIEQFFDPVKGMFLADRYIKGECPVCGTKDQYGDACENCSSVYSPTQLINPYSTLSGAKTRAALLRPLVLQVVGRKVREFPARMVGATRPTAVPSNQQGLGVAGRGRRQGARDWDISRDAPYFGIPIPDLPGKYFYVWLDAPIGYLASLENYCERKHLAFADFVRPTAMSR